MSGTRPEDQIRRLAPLFDPVRRSLYLYVLRSGTEVGRDEAAAVAGISRSLAAFHLDKLVEEGFLEAGYRRLSGRGGPGAGRPAKVYSPAPGEFEVNLPPRDYELVARMMLDAGDPGPSGERRRQLAARRTGRAIGEEARTAGRRAGGRASQARALTSVLEERGYNPAHEAGTIRMRNCPFDALATDYRSDVCGMNLAMLRGLLEGLGASSFRAVRDDPTYGCCVAFTSTS